MAGDKLDPIECEILGELNYKRRRIPEALRWFHKALEAGSDPERNTAARWESWMLLGEFANAWAESDRGASSTPRLDQLTSKRVLIRCLRGLGDAIQFLRYASELRRRCSHLAVQGPQRLLPLLAHFPGIDEASAYEGTVTAYDFELECSSLPYLFRTTVSTIPRTIPYLQGVPPRPLARHLTTVAGTGHLKVGLVWAAGDWNPERSIPLAALTPLLAIPGVTMFSLQRGPGACELKNSQSSYPIYDIESHGSDIVDTAAVICGLDLIISVDTMVAHLAGALRRPVWTLLLHAADWRWMVERSDSPWYPTMSLFRQRRLGDWTSVIDEAGIALRNTVECYSNRT